MADLDLSLSDALTDSVLQPSPESTVERDFMAQLEAEAVDDQVKETVEKADYIPLLDSVDAKADRSTALENGGEEAHELQKPGAVGETWSKQAGCLVGDSPVTPDASMSFAKQADSLAANSDDLLDNFHSRKSDSYAGGDEMDHGLDQTQTKKKKRQQKNQRPYEHPESKDQSEMHGLDAEDFYHKFGPSKEREGQCWEEQLGKSRGQGRKSKSRKKLPEEWAVTAKPFVPLSVATSQNTDKALVDTGSSDLKYPADLCTDMATNQTPWQMEICAEQGFEFSTAEAISPLILNSELKATAAPFTMPSPSNRTPHSSFTKASPSGEPVDVLVDAADLDNIIQGFYPPFCPESKEAGGDKKTSEMFDSTSSLPESSMQDLSDGDTSPFSPASNTSLGLTQKDEMLASAPPLLSSDTSWLMNDSQMSYSNVLDFSDISASSHPLPLGLPFETSSPAPLRSPKTNAQEFQSKQNDAKFIKKQYEKSSSSFVRSTTSPDNKVSLQTSPSYSPPVTTRAPGSGLNPAAKPFFPSFADPMEDPALVPNDVPFMKVYSNNMDNTEKQEEKLKDSVKQLESFDASNRTEQKNVNVECTSTKTLARMEEEEQNGKETESERNKEAHSAVKVEDVKKQTGEVDDKKKKEKLKEEERVKVEFVQLDEGKKSTMPKVEETVNETENVGEVEIKDKLENKSEEADNVENTDRNVKPKVEEKEVKKGVIDKEESEKDKDDKKRVEVDGIKAESKISEKVENKEKIHDYETAKKMKIIECKEQQKVETTHELQSRCTNTMSNKTQADLEVKAGAEMLATEMENTEDAKAENEANKLEKDKVGKSSEEPVDKEQKTKQIKQDNVQAIKKKNSVKLNEEKPKKSAKPASEISSAAAKDRMSSNKKMKPATAAPNPGNALKLRSSTIAVGGSATATTTHPPALSASSATNKTTTKTPSTITACRQRPSATSIRSSSQPSTSTTTSDAKPKGTTTKQPLLSKTSSTIPNRTGSGVSSTIKTSNTAAAKTAAVMRTTSSTLISTSARARNPLASKTDGRPEEKISSLKTSAASSTKPKTTTTTTRRTTSGSGPGSVTLPSGRGQVPEKKPLLPRVPRPTTSGIATTTTSKSTARPSTAPASSICSNQSKIDSANSTKQHVGGRIPSPSQKRNVAASQGKVQTVAQKPGITSRLASKDKTVPSPGRGTVQTLNKMLDARKTVSKSSPKDDVKSKPGGGKLKLKSHEVNVTELAQPKMDSKDNVSPADGRSIQIDQSQKSAEGGGNPSSVGPDPGSDLEKAVGLAAQENVLKDEAHSDDEGGQEPQPLDSRILETSI